MKPTPMRLVLLAAASAVVLLSSACQGVSLARNNTASFASVPVVLQADPDILGGLVGREAVGALGTPRHEADSVQLQRAQLDQRAYVIWKQSQ